MPSPGTPLESLMLMVWRMRQDIRMTETRAVINAIIVASQPASTGGDKALKDSWKEFVQELLPFLQKNEKTQDQLAIEFLKREVKKGPLKVLPLEPVYKGARQHRRRSKK